MLLAIIENMQREDLNPIEEAEGYKPNDGYIWSHSGGGIQRVLGKSRPYITNSLRLAEASRYRRQGVCDRTELFPPDMPERLAAISDEEKQRELALADIAVRARSFSKTNREAGSGKQGDAWQKKHKVKEQES